MARAEKDRQSSRLGVGLKLDAGRNIRAVTIFLLIATFAATGDLLSKHVVFDRLLADPAINLQLDQYLQDPGVQTYRRENGANEKFSRAMLQELHIQRRICFGLSFTLSTNPGVVFGVDVIPSWLVNTMTFMMIIFIIVFFATTPRKSIWLHLALALILGGAIGNLYDRLFSSVALPGLAPIRRHVRDFIDCSDLHYNYVFNIADAWLVIGVAMIILHWLWTAKKEGKRQ